MNTGDAFGQSVALNGAGKFCAVGADGFPALSTSEGAVFSFTEGTVTPGSWDYLTELNPAAGVLQPYATYGYSVAVADHVPTVVSGAPADQNTRGSAFVLDFY